MTFLERRQKVFKLLSELELDALVLCQPQNLRYLCGFSGSDGVLLAAAGQLVFLTDSRYTTQAKNEVEADEICEYSVKSDAIVARLKGVAAKKVGFEASLSYGAFDDFRQKAPSGWHWQSLHEELQKLRLHKSSEELSAITTATELNRSGLAEVAGIIQPGVRECDVALALEFAMRKAGAEEKAFDIIVASGERGAMPHGVASDKVINVGELVTIDFGCKVSGYYSDETVTFAVGEVSTELRQIFDTVLEAHDRAIEAVAPGVSFTDLDSIARDYICACGYGDYFGHGLGHGVGLEVHEAPTVSPRSKLVAEEGMVFTVEPGIYVPGVGGVRIEDMVLVTSEGGQVLTKIPKTFRNILLN